MPKHGVTLVELLLATAFLACGAAVAVYAGAQYGALGHVLGFLAGTFGAAGGFALLGFAVAFGIGVLTGIPEFPVCANGTCRDTSKDGGYRYEDLDGALGVRCACGDLYQKQGRHVYRLHSDGDRRLYMVWHPLRGWRRSSD